MPAKSKSAIMVAAVSFAAVLFTISARAQNAPASALADQLKTQFKLAKLGADASILEPGAVLVIHSDGLLGVPPASAATCLVTYSDGALRPLSADDQAHCGKRVRKLSLGEKVYAVKIDVDAKKDRVSLLVVGCGSCTGAPQSASSKSQIVFQYPAGYLAAAEVEQIEDVINQVVSLDIVKSDPQPQFRDGQNSPAVLTNDDIIKLAHAKLPDSVVLAKIKSSKSEFDTSTEALIKLKQAGASEPVLQAILDAQPAPNAREEAVAPPAPGALNFSVRHRHSLWETSDSLTHYCTGTLTVSSDGTVAYDCAQTDDPDGRCEHVSLPPGSLKEVKMGSAGNLRLVSTTHLNYDFNGNRDDIKQAQAAISRLIQPSKR
jgi:hypothetical protein